MAKQADYGVTCVTYAKDEEHIESVMVHPITDEGKFGAGEKWIRQRVLQAIGKRKTFKTIVKTKDGYKWGASVEPTDAGFLTTEPNETTRDNLGELPEC